MYEARGEFDREFVLSPKVGGVNTQIKRVRHEGLAHRLVGLTGHVGGLFQVFPVALLGYRYPTDLPLAAGQDDDFCRWASSQGAFVGYVEDLHVNHYETTDGQAQRYPEYFARKWEEEK